MMQRPVITGDAETIREVLTHKKHVYLVERAIPQALMDAILELESAPELRYQMVEAAYKRVQQHTIKVIGKEVWSALTTILQK